MKSLGWKPLLSCVAALVAITAFARADVFGLGDGHDDTLRIPAGESQTINRYAAVVAPVRKGDREVRVDALAGFEDGDLVMVLQATGVGPLAAPSNAVFSFSPFELNPVGHWELARVERARGRTLTFGRPLQEDFTPPHAQVIRVPELRDVTIEPGGELRARPWNGSTGGVVAFLVSGDVHNDGLITATGAGFRPGGGGAIFFRARRLQGAGRIEANGQSWAESFAPAFDWEGAPGSISARLLEDARCGALVTRRGSLPPEVAAYSSWRDAPPGGAVLLQAAALTDCPVLVDDGLSLDKAAWGAPEDFVTLVEHGLVLPGTPLVTAPTEGATLEATRARVSGLATPRAMLVAKLVDLEQAASPEVVLPRAWADDDGDFSVELPAGLAAGRYALSVHAEVEGLASPTSEPVSFRVEDAAVTALLADAGTPPSRPTVTNPEPDDKVGRRGTTFRGTADPSSWIRVTVGSETLTAVQANASGNWETARYQPSATGRQHVKVVASTSKNGGTESEAREFDLDVSIDTPLAPTVDAPAAGAKIGKAGTTFRGSTAPGNRVTVVVDDVPLPGVEADENGDWETVLFTPTSTGRLEVQVTATNAYENESDAAAFEINVSVANVAAPLVTFPAADAKVGRAGTVIRGTYTADTQVKVSVNDQSITPITFDSSTTWVTATFVPTQAGTNTLTATLTDAFGNVSPATTRTFDVKLALPAKPTVTFPLANAKVGLNGTVFRGTREAGTTVSVSVNGQPVTPITTPTATSWETGTFVPTTAGTNTATVTVTDAYGNTNDAQYSFDVKLTPPPQATVSFPLANAKVGRAGTVFRGTYATGTEVKVTVAGQVVGPVTYDTASTWSTGTFVPTTAGTNTVTVTATDDYGNTRDTSHPIDVKLDPPAKPTVDFPLANAKVGLGGTVLRGTREAGTTVSVSVNGQPVTPITTPTATSWETGTFVPTTAGTNTVTVTATDGYGNTNSATHPLDVKLDPPAQPSVTFPETDARVGLAGTLFRGTTEPGTTVRVRVGTQVVAPVAYDTATSWSTGTFVPTTAGTNTVSVIATDEYGNDSATATSTFDVKLTRPPLPTVTFPASGARVGRAGTVFRGTYATGTVVKVSVGGQVVTPVIYDSDTTWSTGTFVPTTAGTNTVSVIASDDHGNDSSPAVTRTFDVKLSPPTAPRVTSPAPLTKVGLAGTVLRGTYETGTTVKVRVNGQEVSPVIYDSDSTWSTGRFVPASAGINNVVATATDSHGNEAASDPLPLDVKLARPSKPVPQAPTAGGKVGLAGTQVRGTADVGTTVSVTIGGIHVGDAATNAGQIWDLGLFTNAPAGKPIVHAIATDEYGNVSDPTEFTIDVKITPPAAPIITSPTVIPGTWWVGKAGITVRGTTAVDNAVKLLRETPAGDVTVVELSPAVSDTWSAVVSTQDPTRPYLPHGPHVLKAIATDLYGNTSTASNAVPVEVDVVDPEVPVIAYPEQGSWVTLARPELRGTVGAGTTKVRITIDEVEEPTLVTVDGTNWKYTVSKAFAEREHTVLVSALDGALNESAPSEPRIFHVDLNKPTLTIHAPQEGSVVVEDTPVFQGTVSEQATLLITLDGKTDTVESAGTQWTYRAPPLVDGNSYVFQVIAEDRAGQRSTEKKVAFTVSLAPPGQPTVTLPGNDSWINTNVPTIRGTSDADCTLTLLIDDDVLTSSLRPNLQGNWSYKPTTPLKEGPQTLRVICRDAQNRDSEPSAPVTFRVVTKGPAKPIIVTPAEGDILRRQTFDKIAGTAEPGAIVTAKLNGVDVGSSAVAGPGGDWELEVKLTLNSGTQALVAQAKDRAENLGDESDPRKFVLDFKAPTTTFAEGPSGVVKRTTVTFSLTTSEEVTGFECALDGAAFAPCSTPITFRDLAEGPHFLEVRTTDPAGNVEDPPARRDWTVMRPSTVEGGGVGCAASGAGVPSVVAWLTWIGLLGLRRQRRR